MTIERALPRRGEIWRVNFDPTIGAEIRKTRPAIVVSSDSLGKLPLKLIAPVTSWNDAFAPNVWHVRISPSPENGLTRPSAVDTLQLRGMDLQRFIARLGQVSPGVMDEIVTAIAAVVEYEVEPQDD